VRSPISRRYLKTLVFELIFSVEPDKQSIKFYCFGKAGPPLIGKVTIDGREYAVSDLSQDALNQLSSMTVVDRKIGEMQQADRDPIRPRATPTPRPSPRPCRKTKFSVFHERRKSPSITEGLFVLGGGSEAVVFQLDPLVDHAQDALLGGLAGGNGPFGG
jgi:hypothetical protein